MDLSNRLAAPVALTVNEMQSVVQERVARGIPHGLNFLGGSLDGYAWIEVPTRADGMPDAQWKSSASSYRVADLSDIEVHAALAGRLPVVSPELAQVVCNVATMLEEANSALSSLSAADREALNGLFKKGDALDGQVQTAFASVMVAKSVVDRHECERVHEVGMG